MEQSQEEMILSFLVEAGDELTSGEVLSGKLGLSRAAVWKHVESLRRRGYRIDAVPAKGYRLVEIPDRLSSLELQPLLSTHDMGRVIHSRESLPSTSDVAHKLASEGAFNGEVVIAETQTRGRGRRGRAWFSPKGLNLYMSVILRPELPPARAPELTFVAAVALCETVREAGCEAFIKWPNDVLFQDKKLAGILVELNAAPEKVNFVILGLGVNLNAQESEFPAELRDIAISLAMARGSRVPRALFTAALLAKLEEWLDRHADEGFEPVRERWRALCSTLGKPVTVRSDGETLEGVAEDIDETGALMVRAGDKLERVVAGDVVVAPLAATLS